MKYCIWKGKQGRRRERKIKRWKKGKERMNEWMNIGKTDGKIEWKTDGKIEWKTDRNIEWKTDRKAEWKTDKKIEWKTDKKI